MRHSRRPAPVERERDAWMLVAGLLIAPPSIATRYSPRARAMLGYSIHPPFLGQVNGMHPLRLIDPNYRQQKTHDHALADAFLEKPKAVV